MENKEALDNEIKENWKMIKDMCRAILIGTFFILLVNVLSLILFEHF